MNELAAIRWFASNVAGQTIQGRIQFGRRLVCGPLLGIKDR